MSRILARLVIVADACSLKVRGGCGVAWNMTACLPMRAVWAMAFQQQLSTPWCWSTLEGRPQGSKTQLFGQLVEENRNQVALNRPCY
jgi:hypothetical protein